MKYVAIWMIIFAAISLIVGGVGLLLQWVATDPTKAWLIAVVGAAVLIACIGAGVEYLTDQSDARKRNPRAVIPPGQ